VEKVLFVSIGHMIKGISILGTSVLLEKTPIKNLSYTGMDGRNFMIGVFSVNS
jgi:hypothetical protein